MSGGIGWLIGDDDGIVLLPCAHLVLCQWCAETVAPSVPSRGENAVAPRSNCPVCRARVDKKVKVFRC